MKEDYIKLIFGLKLKQIRTERGLSLLGLSKKSGLSKSYLNEIENGKKFPKPDKIASLSEHLDIPYDDLVSLKLDKNLAPIGDILQSNLLKDIPLELFGLKEFTREHFYLASVRSFQEASLNYFEDLEEAVLKFSKMYEVDLSQPNSPEILEEILVEEFGYTINNDELENHTDLEDLRSIFIPKTKTLLLTKDMDDAQRSFIYAKELAYSFLKITDRLYTFSWIKFENFEQVLNNFYASYFAGALLIPRESLVNNLKQLFSNTEFDHSAFLQLLNDYSASPESVYQRLTNILPHDFNFKDLFFLRFSYHKTKDEYGLNKELHLAKDQSPRATETNEHYCRRWISLKVIKSLSLNSSEHEFGIQISNYPQENRNYLVLASAVKDPFKKDHYRSISIGIALDKNLKKKVNFLDDKSIATLDVGVTCERCSIANCDLREASPKVLEKRDKEQNTADAVEFLVNKYN